MNRSVNNEKRRWQRHPLGAPIRLLTPTVNIDARGLTVSEGGMCLFAVANLGIGTQLEVEFTHPHSRELVRTFAAVRNRAAYLYGIEFLS
jgi:PilZ domain